MAEREQCERCKEWERLDLSRYCPSCDAVWLEEQGAATSGKET